MLASFACDPSSPERGSGFVGVDERGSVVATSGATGTMLATFRHGPHGESSDPAFTRFGFTGQIDLPGTGLLHFKARAYSPDLGRFLQPDPIGQAGGLNLYAYAGNDPVNFTDPSGLVAGTEGKKSVFEPKSGSGGFQRGDSLNAFKKVTFGGFGDLPFGNSGGGTPSPFSDFDLGGRIPPLPEPPMMTVMEEDEEGCSVSSLLADERDRAVVQTALARAAQEVRRRRELSNSNATIGAAILGSIGGGLSIGEVSENVVRGRQEGSSRFIFGCFAGCPTNLEGAQAIAIGIPFFKGQDYVFEKGPGRFNRIIDGLRIPVFVFSPRDNKVTLLEAGSAPRNVDCK